jgi:hypothetical protein
MGLIHYEGGQEYSYAISFYEVFVLFWNILTRLIIKTGLVPANKREPIPLCSCYITFTYHFPFSGQHTCLTGYGHADHLVNIRRRCANL